MEPSGAARDLTTKRDASRRPTGAQGYVSYVKAQSPTPFGAGLMLAEEEREQKDDDLNQLFVAQLKLDCQFQHGKSLVYAGSAANLWKGWLWRLRRAQGSNPQGFFAA